jgi:hypothetical protein
MLIIHYEKSPSLANYVPPHELEEIYMEET